MKLRIRFGKRCERIEVSGDDSAKVLKDEVAVRFSIPPESFDLSLNGKDTITLGDDSIVSDLGVVSGDLLKVITNGQDVNLDNAPCLQDSHSISSCESSQMQTNEMPQQSKSGASNHHDQIDSGKQDNASVISECSTYKHHQDSGKKESTSTETSVYTGSAPVSGQVEKCEDAPREPMVVRDCFGDRLPHRLRQEWDFNKPNGVIEALSLVLHVMMLETGFLTLIDSKADSCSPNDVTYQTKLPVKWNLFGCCRFSYVHQFYDPSQVCHMACVPLGSLLTTTGLISHDTSSSFSLRLKPSEYIKVNKDGFSLSNTTKLSRLFKDSVAHQMTCLLREKSGMMTLTGIVALPVEIQIEILSYLDMRSLLNMSEVCQSLRGLSQVDTLWRHLYLRDMRSTVASNNYSWKEAYKKQYKEVKDRERADEEWRRESVARWGHPSQLVFPGHYHGPLFPGIRGGDYDLHPFGNPFQPQGSSLHPLHPGHMQPRHDPIFADPDQEPIPGPGRGLRDTPDGLGFRHGGNRGMFDSTGRISFL